MTEIAPHPRSLPHAELNCEAFGQWQQESLHECLVSIFVLVWGEEGAADMWDRDVGRKLINLINVLTNLYFYADHYNQCFPPQS
jgi:hypothetical protein